MGKETTEAMMQYDRFVMVNASDFTRYRLGCDVSVPGSEGTSAKVFGIFALGYDDFSDKCDYYFHVFEVHPHTKQAVTDFCQYISSVMGTEYTGVPFEFDNEAVLWRFTEWCEYEAFIRDVAKNNSSVYFADRINKIPECAKDGVLDSIRCKVISSKAWYTPVTRWSRTELDVFERAISAMIPVSTKQLVELIEHDMLSERSIDRIYDSIAAKMDSYRDIYMEFVNDDYACKLEYQHHQFMLIDDKDEAIKYYFKEICTSGDIDTGIDDNPSTMTTAKDEGVVFTNDGVKWSNGAFVRALKK